MAVPFRKTVIICEVHILKSKGTALNTKIGFKRLCLRLRFISSRLGWAVIDFHIGQWLYIRDLG